MVAPSAQGGSRSSDASALAYKPPFEIKLGNVSTSFRTVVYIPVYLINGSSFSNLSQVYSYDGSVLMFEGVTDDVASQAVSFEQRQLATDVVQINGSGDFVAPDYNTTLFYLEFQPLVQAQTITQVVVDSSQIGSSIDQIQSASTVLLASGWESLGPSNVSPEATYNASEQFVSGTIPAIGFSPVNMSIIYAASGRGGPSSSPGAVSDVNGYGGVFRSTDGGKDWATEDVGLGSTEVNSIVVSPTNPDVLVVATGGVTKSIGGGIYKSVNGGTTWQETYTVGGNLLAYVSGALYAAAHNAVLVSHDFGTTWTVVSRFSGFVTTLDVQAAGSTIFVGLYQPGSVQILRSADGGKSYVVVGSFPGYQTVSQVLTDPSNQSQMWALVHHGYTSFPSLFKSDDDGVTWNPVNDSAVGIEVAVFSKAGVTAGISEAPQYITYDPLNGDVMYVVGPGYVDRSNDSGAMFSPLVSSGPYAGMVGHDNRVLTIDPANGSIMYLGSDQGLAVTYNAGYTWTPLNNRSASLIYSVSSTGSRIFTTVQDWGPEVSNDFGKTWVSALQGLSEEGSTEVDPYNDSVVIVAQGFGGFRVSDDGGASFFMPAGNWSQIHILADNAMSVAFANRSIYLATTNGIYWSNDWGKSWNLLPNSPRGDIAVTTDPVDQNVLYASVWGGYSNTPGLFRSTDGGSAWTRINTLVFNALAVDPLNDSIVAAVLWPPSQDYGRLMLSTDAGLNFTDLGFHTSAIFAAAPLVFFHKVAGAAYLIYTTDDGLYVSGDLGRTWQDRTLNLPTRVITGISFLQNGSALLSTYGAGVWYNPELFSPGTQQNAPQLTGYVPTHSTLVVDGNETIAVGGYFRLPLRQGPNNILVSRNGVDSYAVLNATAGSVYFVNFGLNTTTLNIVASGLGGESYNVEVGQNGFKLAGSSTLEIPQGVESYVVGNSSTDYSLLVPSPQEGEINASFLPVTLRIQFSPMVESRYTNITGLIQNGPFWTEALAHNGDYELLAGGGSFGLLNLNTDAFVRGPGWNVLVDSATAYKDGFLLGGLTGVGAEMFFYNLTDGALSNLTSILPPRLQDAYRGSITALDTTTNGSAVVMGSGQGVYYIGLLKGFELSNLTQLVPNSFIGSPTYDGYYGAYLAGFNEEILVTNPSRIGVLNLTSGTFQDYSETVPEGVQSLAHSPLALPTFQSIASSGSVAFLGGIDGLTGGGFEAVFSPASGITDVSNLFPADVALYTISWNGVDFLASGQNLSSNTPALFAYNPASGAITELDRTSLRNFQLVDSIDSLSANRLVLSGYEITAPPGVNYVILSSKYAMFDFNSTGLVEGSVAPSTASVTVDGAPVPTVNGSFSVPEFAGSYNVTFSDHGFSTRSFEVAVPAFAGLQLNVQLNAISSTTTSIAVASTATSAAPAETTSTQTSLTGSSSGGGGGAIPEFPLQVVAVVVFVTVVVSAYLLARSRYSSRMRLQGV